MGELVVSEREGAFRYIAYVAGALAGSHGAKARTQVSFSGGRAVLRVLAEEREASVRALAADRIAEVYCIGYKYELLHGLICPAGLSEEERGILRTAVIAADLAADKRYVLSRLSEVREHTLDGFFRFRLRELAAKWRGIAACVPRVFTRGELAEFMEYLLGGNRGRVFLKGSEVYDARCRRLRRSSLLGDGAPETDTLREIVLSGAGKVDCLGTPGEREQLFLRRYYAGRVGFYA